MMQKSTDANHPSSNTFPTAWTLSFLTSLTLVVLICICIQKIPFDRDLTKYIGVLMKVLFVWCEPEPWEFLQYVCTVICFPVFFFFSNLLISKKCAVPNKRLSGFSFGLLCCMLTGFLLLLLWLITNPLTSVCLALLIGLIMLAEKKRYLKAEKILFLAVMCGVWFFACTRITAMDFFKQPIFDNYDNYHHFYAWWYPIYRVDSGQSIGVDFQSIYGFYPYLIVPVLRLFGEVSHSAVPVLTAVLMVIVSAGYYAFCWRFIRNKLLAALTATVCSLLGPFSIINGTFYLQYHPTRSLFCSLILILIAADAGLKNGRLRTFLRITGCMLAGLGIFWNIETGIIAAVLWAAYCFYIDAAQHGFFTKHTLAAAFRAVLLILAAVGIFILLAESVTYVRCGQFLTKDQILFGITVFTGVGFNMIPMRIPDLWIIIAGFLLTGLCVALPPLAAPIPSGSARIRTIGLFAGSVWGIGSFSYFVGRSHPDVLRSVFPHCIIVCIMLAEHFSDKLPRLSFRSFRRPSRRTIVCAVSAVISLVFVSYCTLDCTKLVCTSLKAAQPDTQSQEQAYQAIVRPAEEIRDWADRENHGQLPNMLAFYSVFYDEILHKKADEDVCCMIDWFYRDNAYSVFRFIRAHLDQAFVIGNYVVELLRREFPDELDELLTHFRLAQIIDALLIEEDGSLYIFVPRDNMPDEKPIQSAAAPVKGI